MKSIYEIMLLMDPAAVGVGDAAEQEVRRILDRAGATIIGIKRWDERRLAYEINHRKRGVYVLAYFEGERGKITGIDRDCQLSEIVMRSMVIKRDGWTSELIERQLAASMPERSERGERGYDDDDDRRGGRRESVGARRGPPESTKDDSDSDGDDGDSDE